MKRMVFVSLTNWAIDRARRDALAKASPMGGRGSSWPAERDVGAFALVELKARKRVLGAVNGHASRAGLHRGQSLADARACVPSLSSAPVDHDADRKALHELAIWCGRYGPLRNVMGGDGIWIDIEGVAHLFGNEKALAQDLLDRLASFGISAKIGIADTAGGAVALALCEGRHGADVNASESDKLYTIALAGQTEVAIAHLPIEGLRLDREAEIILTRLGLRRIGDLLALPRTAIEERFRMDRSTVRRGQGRFRVMAAGVLRRLDQAVGVIDEVLAPIEEKPIYKVRFAFEEPLRTAENIENVLGQMLEQLCQMLLTKDVGARRFRVVLYRADGTCVARTVGTSRPCRSPGHLSRLLDMHIRDLDAGFGIDVIDLSADSIERASAFQAKLSSAGEDFAELSGGELIDRLVGRLGNARVFVIEQKPSYIPELAESCVSPCAAGVNVERAKGMAVRPTFLLPYAEPIKVLAAVPEGAPTQFVWRRKTYRVRRGDGPERIEPEWWRRFETKEIRFLETRDYYIVEDEEGGQYWLYRLGRYDRERGGEPPTWHMHGVF